MDIANLSPEVKAILDGIKTGVDGFNAKLGNIEEEVKSVRLQCDAIDEKFQTRGGGGGGGGGDIGAKAITTQLEKHLDQFKTGGRVKFEVNTQDLLSKATLLSTDLYAAAPAQGVNARGRYPYRLRSVIRDIPVNSGSLFVLRQTGQSGDAGIQSPEGSTKAEISFTFEGSTLQVPTVAAFVNVSRQALDDIPGLGAFLDSTLLWNLERQIEDGLLHGNGVGMSLSGLIPYATAFDSGTLLDASEGWDRATIISAALTQILAAGFMPTHVVMHPHDLHFLRTTRGTTGEYVIAVPTGPGGLSQLWGGEILTSDQITEGDFVAFDASQLLTRTRMETTIDVGEQHAEHFTKNLVVIRAETRLQLVIGQAAAVVEGTFSTSPA